MRRLPALRALPLPDAVKFYHATYIRPRWANQHDEMVTRIGRHPRDSPDVVRPHRIGAMPLSESAHV
jgi:hypothetical protein